MLISSCRGEFSFVLSEGAGGTFGRLTLLNTVTYQELLDCNHSKASGKRGAIRLSFTVSPVL